MMYVQQIDVKIVKPQSVAPEHVSWCGDTEAMQWDTGGRLQGGMCLVSLKTLLLHNITMVLDQTDPYGSGQLLSRV